MLQRKKGITSGGYDVVIPARNEAVTLAAVIRSAQAAEGSLRVIVVDDGSTDDTARIARESGAEVVLTDGAGSKARALAAGVAAASADVLVFFDGDILNAHPVHFDELAQPVLDGHFVMCCGLVDRGSLRATLFTRLPPITGLRAVRREVFTAIPESKLNGFQIEIMINEVVARAGSKTAIRVLAGTGHRSKLDKQGFWRGLGAHVAMTAELLHCFTFVPIWTYRSYLSNLTILESVKP